MHDGHMTAWGSIVAGQLTESHTRYTKMTTDHIVFSPTDNRIRVVGGASGILPIAWPADARLHHDDIALFRREFGSRLTSALRLGYTFRLGPIGEWIFFEPHDGTAVTGSPPGAWSDEWITPDPELALGDDCSLDSNTVARITQMGAAYRKQRSFAAATRCFMRCYLAGIAGRHEAGMAIALGNLATVYLDEGRWLRAFALGLSASFVCGGLPSDTQDWIVSLMRGARSHLEPAMAELMVNAAKERGQIAQSLNEILWHLEDFDVLSAVERGRRQ